MTNVTPTPRDVPRGPRRRAPFLAAMAALSAATIAGCGTPPGAAPAGGAPPPQAVRVVAARTMDLARTLTYVGTVRSAREVRVMARVMGTLTSLPVPEGGRVRRGRVVARIAVPELDVRQQRLAADVQRLVSDRDYFCRTLATDLALHRAGAVPRAAVDASRRRCDAATQAVKAARAGSRELRSSRGKAVERAPLSGRVLRWLAEPGEHVAPGRPILLLGDSHLEVAVQVTETDLGRGIAVGTPATLALAATPSGTPAGRRRAVVRTVAPMASGPGRTVEVRLALPAALRAAARHGASVDVAFVLARERKAPAVPVAALHRDARGASLFVVDKGVARAIRVTAGIAEGDWVAVRPPLPRGARVAVTNLDVLRDGMKVYAVEAERGGR